MSPACSAALGRRARLYFAHHQHARKPRLGATRLGLDFRREPEPLELVVRCVAENRLQRAAGNRLAGLDALERALHARERQIEARRGAAAAAGIERDDAPAYVDHRRARGPARGAGGRLDVESIEVVVLADAVLGGLPIEPRERARQDGELLTGIVAHDADLGADARAFRVQRQGRRRGVAQFRRVVAIEAEVVHRIAIHGPQLDFLAILEHGRRDHRTRGDDVTVGEYQPALGVDHEAGGLARLVPFGVEGPRLVDLDRDNRRRNPRQRLVPGVGLPNGDILRDRRPRG